MAGFSWTSLALIWSSGTAIPWREIRFDSIWFVKLVHRVGDQPISLVVVVHNSLRFIARFITYIHDVSQLTALPQLEINKLSIK